MELLAGFWQLIVDFFTGWSGQEVVMYMIVGLIGLAEGGGFFGIWNPIAQLKKWLKLDGAKMQGIVVALSFVVAAIAMAIGGAFMEVDFKDASQLSSLAFTFYALGQFTFHQLKDSLSK